MASIWDFQGGNISKRKEDDHIIDFKFSIKESTSTRIELRVEPTDEVNYRHITLEIGNSAYRIFPSQIGKVPSKKFPDASFKCGRYGRCDCYSIVTRKTKILLLKQNCCIDEIQVRNYPVELKISGGTMIMERLEIQ